MRLLTISGRLLRTWHPRLVLALSCWMLSCALLAAEAPVPTAEEVESLMEINRHRSDRITGDFRIYGNLHRAFPQVEMSFFGLNGTEPASQPLVFNPALMAAARTLLARGITPVAYEPLDHVPVFATAGYQPAATGLILCGFGQASPQLAYLTSFSQTISKISHSTGFIQPIYGGLGLLAPTWREAGIAQQTRNGSSSVVLVLGVGSATRYLGGQVYADGNSNGICDPNEGVVGASVTVGATTITTGPGGIWWLALSHAEPGDVIFRRNEVQAQRPFTGGTVNQTIDFRLPHPTDVATAQRLASSVEKASKGSEGNLRKTQVTLLSITRAADLDDALRTRVDGLTSPVQSSFDATVREVRSALAQDPPEFKSTMRTLQKKWDGAIPAWFQEWDSIYLFRRSIRELLAKPAGEQASLAGPLLKPLAKARALAYDPDMRAFYNEFSESLQPFEPPTPPPKKKGK